MLIILLFAVLFALKLAAIGIVYNTHPLFGLAIIIILIAIGHRIEPTAASQPDKKRTRH